MAERRATIRQGNMFSFDSQVDQYPSFGKPGIGYFAGVTDTGTVDCLLWRNVRVGMVRGILNYYSHDMGTPPFTERAGAVNIWIDPSWKRRGIATALLREAQTRWSINLDIQRFSPEGLAFITAFDS